MLRGDPWGPSHAQASPVATPWAVRPTLLGFQTMQLPCAGVELVGTLKDPKILCEIWISSFSRTVREAVIMIQVHGLHCGALFRWGLWPPKFSPAVGGGSPALSHIHASSIPSLAGPHRECN